MLTRFFGVTCLALGLTGISRGIDVGDLMVAKRDLPLLVSGVEVDQVGPGQVLRVRAVKGDMIWVSRGRPGWVSSNDVIALDEAEPHFNRPFATGAGSRDYLARGTVRVALGKHREAVADLKKAVEMANEPGDYLESLGYAQLAAHDQPGAIETFNRAVADEPDSAPALMGRGLAYYQVGQNQNAYVDFNKAIQLEPEHAFPRKYLGALLHDLGKLDLAKQQLETAVKIDAYDVFTRKSLGRLHYDLGELDAALNQFDIAVNVDGKDVEAIAGRGVIRHAIGNDLESAAADFAKAIEMTEESIDNAYLWSNLGQMQMELEHHGEAFKNLTKAIQLDPNFTEARSHRVYLLVTRFANTVKLDQAKSDMQNVFASDEPKTYWDYRALAAVNAALGDYARAAKYQALGEAILKKTGPARFIQVSAASRLGYEQNLAEQ